MMQMAIERNWPSKVSPGKLDSWVDHRKEIILDETGLAEICGVSPAEVKEYLDWLEAETSYRLSREWVTRKNMTRKERVIEDKDIILVALAIGKATLSLGKKENELILETEQGEMRIITEILISPEDLRTFIESFPRW